ncbi:MCAT [Symbiodinium sp. KB8]|nr:MCAT [Symbiodinium sp. KB8]
MTAALPDSSIFNISNATQECFWHHPEVYSTTGSSKLLLKLTEDELRREAQTALGCYLSHLIDDSGDCLPGGIELEAAGLADGDTVSAIVRHTQLASTHTAFALLRCDGSVVTWGSAYQGGDSVAFQSKLKDVSKIYSSDYAFAAVRSDGSVVTWGNAGAGGDSASVQDMLRNVQKIQASSHAFAAVLADGSVVTWGNSRCGGDSSAVQGQLVQVQHIWASKQAFAALAGGSLVTWGSSAAGGDSEAVRAQLAQGVRQIAASELAFGAVLSDGSVVTWGDGDYGGDSSSVHDQLQSVQALRASQGAFAALRSDGSVVTWGKESYGANSSAVQEQLKDVLDVQASEAAFAAILSNGSVVTWGNRHAGGNCSAVQQQLEETQEICASLGAFAARKSDGSVVSWGDALFGGDSSPVQASLKDVRRLYSSGHAFAAVLGDGSVVTWGNAAYGGDSGLSLGEYTALTAAGTFDFETGLRLVKLRAEAMQEATEQGPQAMASVAGLERKRLEALCRECVQSETDTCQVANELFPNGFSCAGTKSAIERLVELAPEKAGCLQAKLLKTSGAFHTRLMEPARAKLLEALLAAEPKMKPPKCDLYANLTGARLPAGTPVKEIITTLADQLTNCVLWESCMRAALKDGLSQFYELGPMKQLKSMMKRIDNQAWKDTENVMV